MCSRRPLFQPPPILQGKARGGTYAGQRVPESSQTSTPPKYRSTLLNYYYYLEKLFKSFDKFLDLTPFGPQTDESCVFVKTEILGQVLKFTKGVQKHRTRNLKNLRLRRNLASGGACGEQNPRYFSACGGAAFFLPAAEASKTEPQKYILASICATPRLAL